MENKTSPGVNDNMKKNNYYGQSFKEMSRKTGDLGYCAAQIIKKALNPGILDHYTYDRDENGAIVVYTEPYNPMNWEMADMDVVEKWGIKVKPLKESKHDSATYPYKITITKLDHLSKRIISKLNNEFYPYGNLENALRRY